MAQTASISKLVEATPNSRDRYMDLLRAFSIAVVVFGHWLMAIVYMGGGRLDGANALDVVPGLWLATWALQVMPLFFIVGGFSNLVAWRGIRRRNETYPAYLRSRIGRLMRPTLVFVVTWSVVAVVAAIVFPGSSKTMHRATELLAKPLWFLAVYVLVVALAPLMAALHDRHGLRVPLFLAGAAVIVDMLRIAGGLPAVGYLNFAFVWLFAHQLGYFYADGSLDGFSRKAFAVAGAGALGVLALLTGSGIYSPSMVGMAATTGASNNSPPTVCLIVLTVWLGSAAMVARPAATRWLQGRKPWTVVVAANSMIMTVFLWHLTALLVGVLLLYPIGFPQPEGGTALWWAWRPVWLVALTGLLAPFVAVFGRFERSALRTRTSAAAAIPRIKVVTGICALVAGLAGLAQFGFSFHLPGGAPHVAAQPLLNAFLVLFGNHVLAGANDR